MTEPVVNYNIGYGAAHYVARAVRISACLIVLVMAVAAHAAGEDRSAAEEESMGKVPAARLLSQATFGATLASIDAAATRSYTSWFTAQAALSPSLTLPTVTAPNAGWEEAWFDNVMFGSDQLRQRMAFALSEIMVVSSIGPLGGHNYALAYYYDTLARNSLGNFRTLLQQVTLSPAMGEFLSVWKNQKPNAALSTHADQNYAREIMQLFTVGLVKLNLDGTVQTDGGGNPIATYTQTDVANLSNVFTGWASAPATHTGEDSWRYDLNEIVPMVAYQDHHDTSRKVIIGGIVVPARGSAEADLQIALDALFKHPNVAPFICKQLIERLVTSNPSPAYVQRVALVFIDDGKGVRGNLLAVARAILTDKEAVEPGGVASGKVREPLLRLTGLWRAFDAYNSLNRTNEYNIGLMRDQYFGEYPLGSPTVFNFFVPDFQKSGRLAGLVVPEFQITNENTLVSTANQLQLQAYQFIDASGAVHAGPDYDMSRGMSPTSVMLHTAAWEPVAAEAAALIDRMNLVLMAGQMPPAMRKTLIAYVNAIPASSPGSRVVEAAELIVNSPQYAVQR